MTSIPSRNTRISLIGLVILGLAATGAIIVNIETWLEGGMAIKRVVQTCNVVGTHCSGAYTSILQILGSPQQLLLSLLLAALLVAMVKAIAVIISARRVATCYKHPMQAFPKLKAVLEELGAENIRVRVAGEASISAFTYGVLKPSICISKGLIEKLSESELSALMAHEIGHIKRRDNLAIFLARFVRDFLWPLPISHFLFSSFISEKEYAADDFAVTLTGKPLELAGAIVTVAKAVQSKKALSPAYATFFSNKATARTRVGRLIGSEDRAHTSLRRLLISSLISIVMLAAVVGFAYAQPSIKGDTFDKCKMGGSCAKHNYKCCNLK